MAEDKKIRVSADLSGMRQIRENIVSTYREINLSENESIKATEKSLNQLREQLSLMSDQVELEKMLADLRRRQIDNPITRTSQPQQLEQSVQQSESTQRPFQQPELSPRPSLDPVVSTEENSITWNVERPQRNDESESEKGSFKPEKQRTSSTAKAIESLTNVARDIDKNVSSMRDFLSVEPENKDRDRCIDYTESLRNILGEIRGVRSDLSSQEGNQGNSESRNQTVNLPREEVVNQPNESFDKGCERIVIAIESTKSHLSQKVENVNTSTREIVEGTKLIIRYLETIGASVSIIEDNATSSQSAPPSTGGGGGGGGAGIKGGIAGGLTAIIAQNILKYGKELIDTLGTRYNRNQQASAQSLYQDPISNVGLAFKNTGANEADYYKWIPLIGNHIAENIQNKYGEQGNLVTAGLSALRQAQNQVVPLAQTMGISNSGAMGMASREGGYAAGALGMDIGEYGERRAQLIRSSGGRITNKNESQSLMAAEKYFGINTSTTNALQGSMRFNENSKTTGSEIINVFERQMRELQLPFSEIASTIEESLTTFNKTSERVLSKTGELDAGRITAIMAGVRGFTDAKGKQLERYQSTFSGQGISEDQTSQAFLQRAYFRMNPGAQLSDFKVAKDDWTKGDNVNVLIETMKDIQKAAGGSKQGTFSALEQFTNLSATDIEGLFKPGSSEIDFDKLKDSINSKAQLIADRELTYSKDTAQGVTGIEGMFKEHTNRMISVGGDNTKVLEDIFEEVKKIIRHLDPAVKKWDELEEETKGVSINRPEDKGKDYRLAYYDGLNQLKKKKEKDPTYTQEQFEEDRRRLEILAKKKKIDEAAFKEAQAQPVGGGMLMGSRIPNFSSKTDEEKAANKTAASLFKNIDKNGTETDISERLNGTMDRLRKSVDTLNVNFSR